MGCSAIFFHYIDFQYFSSKSDRFTSLYFFLIDIIFFGWNVIFLIVLLTGYHKGLGAVGLVSRIRLPEKVPADVLLLFCTPLLIAFAYVLRAVNINYVAALTSIVGLALASAAAKALVTRHCPARHLARGIPAEFAPPREDQQASGGPWFD